MAGGPPVAERLGLSTFHFVNRQVIFWSRPSRFSWRSRSCRCATCAALALLVYLLAHRPRASWRCNSGPRSRARIAGSCSAASACSRPNSSSPPSSSSPPGPSRRARGAATCRARSSALLLLPATIVPLDPAARFRPDHAHDHRLVRLLFVAGLHWFWVLGLGGARRRRHLRRLSSFMPHVRDRIERFLDKSSGRHLPGRHRHGSLRQGRLARQRPGRGHRQAHPARRPYRLHLRRDGGGVRHRRLPRRSSRSSPSSCCAAFSGAAQRGPLLPPRGDRAHAAVRPAGEHQHGGQRAPDAGQGHDAAVHLLRRLLAALAGARPWAS